MKRLILLAGFGLAACEPLPVTVGQSSPARAPQPVAQPVAEPAPVIERAVPAAPAIVSGGIPINASLDCSVRVIGLFGQCEDHARTLCNNAGLTLARFDKIDPANPEVVGIATNNAAIVESGLQPATHRVTCV